MRTAPEQSGSKDPQLDAYRGGAARKCSNQADLHSTFIDPVWPADLPQRPSLTPLPIATDQKVGGSSPSERAHVFPGRRASHSSSCSSAPSSGLILALSASPAALSSRSA